jgi:isopentenyl-diphosphate delta-isomerase
MHRDDQRASVSFDDEPLILVDEQDNVVGHLDKLTCHNGDGLLHRAFSLFICDTAGRVLLQQRAAGKRLWPLFWSNSVCSHPRRGESVDDAVVRRAREELGMRVEPRFLYKFSYAARYGDLGAERELCWVYLARSEDEPVIHADEVAALRWLEPSALTVEMREHPAAFTPWSIMEWEHLLQHHSADLQRGGLAPGPAARAQ